MTKASRLTGVLILTLGVAAGAWGWSSLRAADPVEPAKSPTAKGADPVRELQKERLALLESIRDMILAQYKDGRTTGIEVEQAQAEVLRAQLEIAESSQERIAICRELVVLAESRVKMAEALVARAVQHPSEALRARVGLLEAKIALEREIAAAH